MNHHNRTRLRKLGVKNRIKNHKKQNSAMQNEAISIKPNSQNLPQISIDIPQNKPTHLNALGQGIVLHESNSKKAFLFRSRNQMKKDKQRILMQNEITSKEPNMNNLPQTQEGPQNKCHFNAVGQELKDSTSRNAYKYAQRDNQLTQKEEEINPSASKSYQVNCAWEVDIPNYKISPRNLEKKLKSKLSNEDIAVKFLKDINVFIIQFENEVVKEQFNAIKKEPSILDLYIKSVLFTPIHFVRKKKRKMFTKY